MAEKDKVAVRMIFEETIAEFGKKIRVVHHWIARIEKGKITEVWDTADTAGMLEQLGYKITPGDK